VRPSIAASTAPQEVGATLNHANRSDEPLSMLRNSNGRNVRPSVAELSGARRRRLLFLQVRRSCSEGQPRVH
jgi:hypothetical protein